MKNLTILMTCALLLPFASTYSMEKKPSSKNKTKKNKITSASTNLPAVISSSSKTTTPATPLAVTPLFGDTKSEPTQEIVKKTEEDSTFTKLQKQFAGLKIDEHRSSNFSEIDKLYKQLTQEYPKDPELAFLNKVWGYLQLVGKEDKNLTTKKLYDSSKDVTSLISTNQDSSKQITAKLSQLDVIDDEQAKQLVTLRSEQEKQLEALRAEHTKQLDVLGKKSEATTEERNTLNKSFVFYQAMGLLLPQIKVVNKEVIKSMKLSLEVKRDAIAKEIAQTITAAAEYQATNVNNKDDKNYVIQTKAYEDIKQAKQNEQQDLNTAISDIETLLNAVDEPGTAMGNFKRAGWGSILWPFGSSSK